MPDSYGPRAAAHALILAVLAERRSLSELADTRTAALDAPDRARALRLATAGFRHAGRADAVLRPHLRKPPPEPVAWALRLGTVEMALPLRARRKSRRTNLRRRPSRSSTRNRRNTRPRNPKPSGLEKRLESWRCFGHDARRC